MLPGDCLDMPGQRHNTGIGCDPSVDRNDARLASRFRRLGLLPLLV
jgi:hypothetical protein